MAQSVLSFLESARRFHRSFDSYKGKLLTGGVMHRLSTIFFMILMLLNHGASAQGAKGAMSSGDKGYRLGCSMAQKPCENSCGEIWSPSALKEQERRCEEHKRQQRQECRKRAYDDHKTEGKRCSEIKDAYPSIDCYNANNKTLEKRLADCKL